MGDELKQPPRFSPEDYYRVVRGQIEHEDNLIGTRLNWFTTSQSFLFSAYAIVLSNLRDQDLPWVHRLRLLVVLIPMIAVFVCVVIFAVLVAGVLAMRRLRHLYAHHAQDELAGLPPVQGFRLDYLLGQAGPMLLPIGFFCVWIFLLLHGIL